MCIRDRYFGIAKLYERTTNSLSGGQKQLLNLAAVMTMQPKVIILDEPTAQLDPIAAEKFIQMLHKINDELGTTVIISEHRLDQLLPVCSNAVVMKNGEILADDNSYKVADKLYNTEEFQFMPIPAQIYKAVSYTHLDVYKRQTCNSKENGSVRKI